MFTDDMAAGRASSFRRVGSLMRSKSEGTLIDLNDKVTTSDSRNGKILTLKRRQSVLLILKDLQIMLTNVLMKYLSIFPGVSQNSEWLLSQPSDARSSQSKNPFWNKLSASNPFLDDIERSSTEKPLSSTFHVKSDNESPTETNDDCAFSTSSDEENTGTFSGNQHGAIDRSGRCRSASDILDDLERKVPKRENSFKPPRPVLNPDFEWLKNDREAYKMAWLSHRQLTRSCLDLNLMSQSPGWAQTQATGYQVTCKVGHAGGSVQLPASKISIHLPEGHVPPGEVQEVTLKAKLDPPPGLNNNYMTTMSPLLEVVLSNINIKEGIALEMKLAGEVKSDPLSQVMTTVVGMVSNKKEGPYVKVNNCYIYKNMMQIKLRDFKTHFFVIAVAEASAIQSPATSVWDYLDRRITVAVYGPRFIHPSFKVVVVVCGHGDVPPRLPFSDICRGNKNVPALVLQLWGKHEFTPEKLDNLHVGISLTGSVFKVKPGDSLKEVRHGRLLLGTVFHLPVALSCARNTKMTPFNLDLEVKDSKAAIVAHFQVPSPPAAPIRAEKRVPRLTEKQIEMPRSPPITEESASDSLKFTDRPVNLQCYGVALKSVFRQPRVDYLLEYFKGDTVALLSRETVKSVGNSKVKEWYIGFLRGRTGLVHCRNVKLITADQVIDFTGVRVSTEVLLDNMTLPFKKLTYMYSAIQTLVTEHITSWRGLADALGYSELPLDTITRTHAETEADKVACVLEKLKEDCHADKSKKKFLHELMVVSGKKTIIYSGYFNLIFQS